MRTRSHIINTNNILKIIEQRQVNFIKKCLNHKSELVKYVSLNCFLNRKSYTVRNINNILNKSDIPYISLFNEKKVIFKESMFDNWRINLIKELINIRDNKLFINFNFEQFQLIFNYVCCC